MERQPFHNKARELAYRAENLQLEARDLERRAVLACQQCGCGQCTNLEYHLEGGRDGATDKADNPQDG